MIGHTSQGRLPDNSFDGFSTAVAACEELGSLPSAMCRSRWVSGASLPRE
jgi:hypothetical protein